MALSVVDIYQKLLPKTNCRDCGLATCLAFASMVVSEQWPLEKCPHIEADVIEKYRGELAQQYAQGKWTRKDPAEDALLWARQRAASMRLEDLPARIGGELVVRDGETALRLPYFSDHIIIAKNAICKEDGGPLSRWEQVFIYNHMAQGGSADPTDTWKGLEQIPNTISKIKSMRRHVELPLIDHFSGKPDALKAAARPLGAIDISAQYGNADVTLKFQPLPRIPVILLFWDAEPEDELEAQVKLLFNETITQHLDIESILFLSERLCNLLCHNG
jgi:hypothetical protein